MKTSVKNLESTGFVNMSYPQVLREAVLTAASSWKAFCALPVEIKKTLPYSNTAAGVGYELKDGQGNKADRKENFDISIGGAEWLARNLATIDNPSVRTFVENASKLVELSKPLVHDFAEVVEREYGLTGFLDEVKESEPGYFFRFIHYFGDRKTGEETATAHVDQSGCTFHFFETSPGFQVLDFGDRKWKDIAFKKGETLVISSMQMQLKSKGRLRALCHRVVATEETAKVGRYSAVCFVQFARTAKYDKNRSGRLQEKTPGFNYDMPLPEFTRLFK